MVNNTGFNEKLKIEDFGKVLSRQVQVLLGEGYEVDYKEVTKNNGVKFHALLMKKQDRSVAPTVYFDSYYQEYRNGAHIIDIARQMVKTFNHFMPPKDQDMDFFEDFSQVSENLFFKVVNLKKNKKKLEDVPYRKLLDMAMVPLCRVDSKVLGEGVITILKSHLKLWEITEDELWENIGENAAATCPPKVQGIFDVIEHVMGAAPDPVEGCGIYVVSNESGSLGASAAFYPGVLKGLSEDFESDLYIIPSSVHEVLVIPESGCLMDTDGLRQMIREVNTTTVSEQDVLSDNLYRYDFASDKVYMVKGA
jgi:hypothetical protein